MAMAWDPKALRLALKNCETLLDKKILIDAYLLKLKQLDKGIKRR